MKSPGTDPAELLLQIVASSEWQSADLPPADVPGPVATDLDEHLRSINVDPTTSNVSCKLFSFVDESAHRAELYLARVSNDDAESFRASYLYAGGIMVAKREVVSS